MTITVHIPEELADQLVLAGEDPARTVLEAMALEAYRNDRFTEAEIRELLGFETRMEVHGFLKKHGAFLRYTDEDLQHDRQVALQVSEQVWQGRDAHPAE